MILPPVGNLAIVSVEDRGVPNRERVLIRPMEPINLQEFIVALAVRAPEGMVNPLHDHVFWFPELVVSPPAWLVLHTGPGTPTQATMPDTGQPAHIFFWGKLTTVLNQPEITPVIFGLSSILVPSTKAGEREAPGGLLTAR